MKYERSNVEFPIWRKKGDKSLFEHNGTTIPEWACRMWGLSELYRHITSRKSKMSTATVLFERRTYQGWVTTAPHGRRSPAYRLWFEEELGFELKRVFLMSYMRSLEGDLTSVSDIEERIPFWEFLDIEFDNAEKSFRFVAYFPVKPEFPELFRRLVGSPAVRRVDDELRAKKGHRIHKLDWKPRDELRYEIGG